MIKKLLITILPIVFAVLLALALDAWYDNLKQKQTVQNSLTDIAQDIQIYADMQSVYGFNQERLDTLRQQIENYERGEQVEFRMSFGRPEINALAWQMARETGIAASFGRVLYKDIARVFNEFERLDKLWNYNYQFKLERDPDMDEFVLARHIARQMDYIQARNLELMEKSAEFLKDYKEASFIKAIGNSE